MMLYPTGAPIIGNEEAKCSDDDLQIISLRIAEADSKFTIHIIKYIAICEYNQKQYWLGQLKSKYPTIYSQMSLNHKILFSPKKKSKTTPDLAKIYNIKKMDKCLVTSPMQRINTALSPFPTEYTHVSKNGVLADYLYQMLLYLREAELIKHELSLQPDFDFTTLMHLVSKSSTIPIIDFYDYLIEEDICTNKEGVMLLYRRFSSSVAKVIDVSDFIDMILPVNDKMACLMKDKSHIRSSIDEKHESISPNTKAIFNRLIRSVIANEQRLNEYKRENIWEKHLSSITVANELCEIDQNNSARVRQAMLNNSINIYEYELNGVCRLLKDHTHCFNIAEVAREFE